jgi:NADH:ubiquinone oxidoreductase subunit K
MEYYLVLSTIMMFVGIYGFVTRRNLLAMLISVELILNSVDINFVVFNRFLFPEQLEGFFFTLFAIGIRRNGRRNRHHHQHLPEPAQHRGEEPAGDEVVTILKKRLLWNIRSLSCCCRC